ncbi:hypothetical protein PUN28_020521 [Cardiocondyla obscurior]|uniref:Uncharacterized protein n=1 Tax=Cardiocondyla obscurior TaxID=286306 RepID=A0AAW2E8J9_9HYME
MCVFFVLALRSAWPRVRARADRRPVTGLRHNIMERRRRLSARCENQEVAARDRARAGPEEEQRRESSHSPLLARRARRRGSIGYHRSRDLDTLVPTDNPLLYDGDECGARRSTPPLAACERARGRCVA